MSSLLNTAREYRDAGLSVIGINDKNNPEMKWHQYQDKLPSDQDLDYMFVKRGFQILAFVTGPISGNLEVIDVDTKYDLTGTMWTRLWEKIVDYYKGQPPFHMVQTPSGGMHLYYKCDIIEGNQVFAHRPPIEGEKQKRPLIETRGTKGIIFASPTEGYKILSEGFPNNIPTITEEEREDIHAICREFNLVEEVAEEPHVRKASTYKRTPWGEYNEDDHFKSVLIDAGWQMVRNDPVHEYWRRPEKEEGHSATWHKEGRWFYVFSGSTNFETGKGLKPFEVFKTLQCNGDLHEAVRQVKALGYGTQFSPQEEGFIAQCTEGLNSGMSFDELNEAFGFVFESNFRGQKDVNFNQLAEAAKSRSIDAQDIFWVEDEESGKLSLDKAAMGDFLERRGYRLFVDQEDAETFRLVHINYKTRIIQYVPLDKFRKDIERSLYEVEHKTSIRKLRNLIRGIPDATLRVAIDFLPRIPLQDITFLKKAGNEHVQWFAFENGAVRVDKEDVNLVPYEELPTGVFVWKKDIKKFKFEVSDIELEEEFNEAVIWLFFKRLAGITPELQHLDHQTELPAQYPDLAKKFYSIITVVGYLLSSYKNMDESIMPILEEDLESSAQGGGTGKGLLIDIVGMLRNVVKLDCKTWSPTRSFPYQKVKLDTDIIHLEDYDPSQWKIESINNVITSGLDIENKFEGEFNIPYPQSPKPVMSSNYRVSDGADFEARRQKKIYLSRYFTRQYRPATEFKKEIGRGSRWTDFDQAISYNILIYSLQYYLLNGLIDFIPTMNVIRKGIIEEFKGREILDFLDDFVKENHNVYVTLKEVHEEFIGQTGVEKKYFGLKRFRHALEVYALKMGYQILILRNNSRTIGEKNQYYFIFTKNDTLMVPFEAKCIKGFVFLK